MNRVYVDLIEIEASAAADWLASREIRAEFRGNRERYFAYRRAAAQSRIPTRVSSERRGEAIEAANDAARSGGNIDSAAIGLWKSDANVRKVFGDVSALVEHMQQIQALVAQQLPHHPAAE